MSLLFGKYNILEELSDGTLFRANDESDRSVLLKIADRQINSEEEIEYFIREFTIVSNLNKFIPEVIEAVEIINDGNKICCVYEYIDGENLYEYRSKHEESYIFWTEILKKTTIALGKIHTRNTLHKDVSPYNIIFSPEDNKIKIIDFGLANTLDMETGVPSMLMGNPLFVSPEQTGRISRSIDIRSDFYSLGMTFYYCFSGVFPYSSKDISSLIYNQIATVPSPLLEFGIPKPISDVIGKLIAKNPDDRYQTLDGLLYDINILLDIFNGTYKNSVFKVGNEDTNTYTEFLPVFGRDNELNYLTTIFEKCIGSTRKVVFLAGPSGMGKTALVNEFRRKVALYKGVFLTSRFEQFNKDTPYSAISNAIGTFLKRYKLEDPEHFKITISRIKSQLGDNLSFAVKILPDIRRYFSNDFPLQEEIYAEYDNRALVIVSDILSTISMGNEPILLFMDNMQWCDESSLKLFKRLVDQDDLTDITIIFSYRKGGAEFLLKDIVKEYGKNPDFFLIQLQALSSDAVSDILADRFKIDGTHVHSLTTYFMSKTRGNPLLIEQVLRTLLRKNMFTFNSISSEWEWSLNKIEQCDISESIGELLTNELDLLSPSKQKLLEIASCIGQEFSLRELFLFRESNPNLRVDLSDMILQGYILPMDMNYRLLSYNNIDVESIGAGKPVMFRFQHTSIHNVVYNRLNKEEKEQIHYILAQNILDDSDRDENCVIKCAFHILASISRIDTLDLDQCIEILNVAGELSIQRAAYNTALNFVSCASKLISDPKSVQHSIIRKLYITLMKSYYLTGMFDKGEEIAESIYQLSNSGYERAELCRVQMYYYKHLGLLHKCINKGFHALKEVDYSMSAVVTNLDIIKSFIPVKMKLARFTSEELFYMNEGKDPRVALIISILGEFIVPSFITGETNLFALSCIKQVELTLKYGTFNESAHAYSNLAILLSGMGDIKKGFELSNLAIKLVESKVCTYMAEMIYSSRTVFNTCWMESWESITKFSKKGMSICLAKGEQFFLAHEYSYVNQWNAFESLPKLIEHSEGYLKRFKEINNFGAEVAFRLLYQRWLNLTGKLPDIRSLDSDDFNSEELLKELKKRKYVSGVALYHIHMMIILYHNGVIEEGINHYYKTKEYIHSLAGGAYIFEFVLYGFLLNAKYYENKPERRRVIIKELIFCSKKMKKWAKYNPLNFKHFDLLFHSEINRLKGHDVKARKFYVQTMKAVEASTYIRDKAIILELVSHFYIKNGEISIGLYILHDAYRSYYTWGASRKATEIINKLSNIGVAERFLLYSKPGKNPGTTQLNSNQLIDLVSLIKVSQALSGELDSDTLLKKVVKEVSKNMGAEKTYYMHREEGDWLLYSKSEKMSMLVATSISHKIIDSVLDTRKSLYLEDASQDSLFSHEKYIKANGIKSVFCYPVIKKDEVVGLWYLENNLITGAFTTAREEILSILSSQLSISLENAKVYRDLEDINKSLEIKVEERTEELVALNKKLEKLSITDSLTNLYNRYKFDELLNYETQRVNRTKEALSMILIDVDHFKNINDNYGHTVGDDVLVRLAKDFQEFVRTTDTLARWGGEEFVILLPDTPLRKAEHVAEQIRSNIERCKSYPSGPITISLGVVEYNIGESLRSLIEKADIALYDAKNSGRNVVRIYNSQ